MSERGARDARAAGAAPTDEIDERHPLEDIFHKAVEKGREDGDLTVNELLEVFGARSLGPILVVFGLIATVPPIGAIPLVPTVTGVLTLLFSLQFALGRNRIWVPRAIAERGVGQDKLEAAERRAGKVAAGVDRLLRRRLSFLTTPPMNRAVAVAASALALLMPPLELVPFGVVVPGLALVCLGLGLTAKDGLFTLLGLLVGAGAVVFVLSVIPRIAGALGALFG